MHPVNPFVKKPVLNTMLSTKTCPMDHLQRLACCQPTLMLVYAPENLVEINAVESDGGRHLGYYRVVGRRRSNVHLNEKIVSVPSSDCENPLLRTRPEYP